MDHRRRQRQFVIRDRDRVLGLLRERGLTQNQLATTCGLGKSYVSHLFHGTRGASIPTARRIAAALDVPVEDLFQLGAAEVDAGRTRIEVKRRRSA